MSKRALIQSNQDLSKLQKETCKVEILSEKSTLLDQWIGRFDLGSANRLVQDMHGLKNGTFQSYEVLYWRLVHMAASKSDHDSLGMIDDAMIQQTTSRALRYYRELTEMYSSGELGTPQIQFASREKKWKLGLAADSCGLTMRKVHNFLSALDEIFEILKIAPYASGFPIHARFLLIRCGIRKST